jgi:hypothetical protein
MRKNAIFISLKLPLFFFHSKHRLIESRKLEASTVFYEPRAFSKTAGKCDFNIWAI